MKRTEHTPDKHRFIPLLIPSYVTSKSVLLLFLQSQRYPTRLRCNSRASPVATKHLELELPAADPHTIHSPGAEDTAHNFPLLLAEGSPEAARQETKAVQADCMAAQGMDSDEVQVAHSRTVPWPRLGRN